MAQGTVDVAGIKIRAIAASDKEAGRYALFGDNRLFLMDTSTQAAVELATLPNRTASPAYVLLRGARSRFGIIVPITTFSIRGRAGSV